MVQAFNAHLPPDIRALEIWPVAENFHARYAAHAKTYRYYILNARVDDPFTFDTCCRIGPELDVAAMQAAAERFVGTHDFLALCASGSSVAAHGDTVRTITRCTVDPRPAGQPRPPPGWADPARQRPVFGGCGVPGTDKIISERR